MLSRRYVQMKCCHDKALTEGSRGELAPVLHGRANSTDLP